MKNIIIATSIIMVFSACESEVGHTDLTLAEESNNNGLLSPEQIALAGIETGKLDSTVLGTYVQTTGVVDVPPSSLASVYCATEGFIRSTNFLPGDFVRRGQVLATVSHPNIITFQKDFLTAHFSYQQLKNEWERQSSLLENYAGSQKAYDAALAAYKIEKVRLEGLEKELILLGLNPKKILEDEVIISTLEVVAPISGYVDEVNVNLGKLIGPSDLLYQLIDVEHVHLEIDIFTKDLPVIEKGQHFRAHISGKEALYEGEVYLVGQAVDSRTNKAKIHGHFHNEPIRIAPGTFMNVTIQTEEKAALTLPETGIVENGGEYFVFLEKGDGYEKVPVEIGINDNGLVEIKNASQIQNEIFVTKGAYYIEGIMAAEE